MKHETIKMLFLVKDSTPSAYNRIIIELNTFECAFTVLYLLHSRLLGSLIQAFTRGRVVRPA